MKRQEQLLSEIDDRNLKGLELKNLHDGEILKYGERGEERPRSRGKTYDIALKNGTYHPDTVDLTGGDATDINKIMERIDPSGKKFNEAVKNGIVTDAGMYYDDFTDSKTLQEALDIVNHSNQQFNTLDAKFRNQFDNDPGKFLDYINDPKNLEDSYTRGIRVRKVTPEPDATNKDVINAIRESASTASKSKKAPRDDD